MDIPVVDLTYTLKRDHLPRLVAILVLCLFLLPVTMQLAHTHPVVADSPHLDCPACIFGANFHSAITPAFNLAWKSAPCGDVILPQAEEFTPEQNRSPKPQRAPPGQS